MTKAKLSKLSAIVLSASVSPEIENLGESNAFISSGSSDVIGSYKILDISFLKGATLLF